MNGDQKGESINTYGFTITFKNNIERNPFSVSFQKIDFTCDISWSNKNSLN